MSKKPTYEELEQRIIALEKEVKKGKQAEEALWESEETLKAILAASPVGIGFSRDRIIKWGNKALYSMLGYEEGSLEGKNVRVVYADDKEYERVGRELYSVGQVESRWVGKDGRGFYCHIQVSPLDPSDPSKGFIIAAMDINQRKQAEDELQDTKQKWMSLVENTNDFIMIIDDKGKIQYINRTIPPHTVNQVIGKTLYDFASPEHHETIRHAVAKVFETRGQGSYTSSVEHSTGIQWFETTMVPVIEDEKVTSAMSFNKIITARRQAEDALLESEERFRQLAEGTFEAIVLHEGGVIVDANNQYYELFGYNPEELAGKDAISLTATPESVENIRKQISLGNLGPYEITGVKKDGTTFPMESRIKLIEYKGRKVRLAAIRDLSERMKWEAALKKRTKELELKTQSLEEMNIAMKVLLEKRQQDKIEVEDNVLTNVKELVEPYFKKIKKTRLNEQQKTFLNIIESNIGEIISPFTRRISLKYLTLTPKEIQVANLIKHGSSTKKIAQIMNISPRTVDTHRKNIRKKVGLEKMNENLRSYLLSFQ